MPHVLKNEELEVHIDLPEENYRRSRFDWTGKIVDVRYKGRSVAGVEIADVPEGQFCGRGFYNEFGIDMPVGYDDIKEGEWFHKIGVGLLKKEGEEYDFQRSYEIRPAEFEVTKDAKYMQLTCRSELINGFAYVLEKGITLLGNSFIITYTLINKGDKPIVTNEYNHNFLAVDGELIGKDYVLQFPFMISPEQFSERVDPEQLVKIEENKITFKGTPEKQFFFRNISGGREVHAFWKLENKRSKLDITEAGDFKTHTINLWGWRHVISPELFYHIDLQPGQSAEWMRMYHISESSYTDVEDV